jgi:cysteine synthase
MYAALNMLLHSKDVTPKTKTIIEQSSGSTVISLSLAAKIYHGIEDVHAYITNKTSTARMRMLKFFGLQL